MRTPKGFGRCASQRRGPHRSVTGSQRSATPVCVIVIGGWGPLGGGSRNAPPHIGQFRCQIVAAAVEPAGRSHSCRPQIDCFRPSAPSPFNTTGPSPTTVPMDLFIGCEAYIKHKEVPSRTKWTRGTRATTKTQGAGANGGGQPPEQKRRQSLTITS